MACPDLGSKCDASGNICYYNTTTCQFDCQTCSSGTYCQMQGGRAVCTGCTASQQDNTLLINGKSGTVRVTPGQQLTASIRNTNATANSCLGVTPTWGIIARTGPVNPQGTEVRVDSGTNYFDTNGCGTTSLTINVEGTYTLVARSCCAWDPLQNYAHCLEPDSDSSNVISLVVASALPSTSACDQSCTPDKNFCLLGTCVPKSYVFIGAIAFFALMLTRK